MKDNTYLYIGFACILLLVAVTCAVTLGGAEGEGSEPNAVVFWGEGDKWSAQIKEEWTRAGAVAGEGETTRTKVRRIFSYKGRDPDSVGEVDYYLIGSRAIASGTYKPDAQGRIILPVIEGSFAAAEKSDIWTLVLKWDDCEEIIYLKAR